MKLYTREQMIKAFDYGQNLKGFAWIGDMIDSLDAIELPTDEEIGVIALNIADTIEPKLDTQEEAFYLAGFQTFAKWMRDKIQGGNK